MREMRIVIQKWGRSAAIRIPAHALIDAGMQIGQVPEGLEAW
jgi:antitoxin MazE